MNQQEQILAEMWEAGASAEDIGRRIGLDRTTVHKWRKRLGLPGRTRNYQSVVRDPTPEELEQRKREVFERHLEQRRNESENATNKRVWSEDKHRFGKEDLAWRAG